MRMGRHRVNFQADAANGFKAVLIYGPYQELNGVITPNGLKGIDMI